MTPASSPSPSTDDIRQTLFYAQPDEGPVLALVVLTHERLALLKNGRIDRVWDADALGTNAATFAFANLCRQFGIATDPRPN